MHGPDKKNFRTYFIVAGGGQGATGQNAGQSFINLTDFSEREGRANSADELVHRARGAFSGFRDAQVCALIPPAIRGLGQSGGFSMQLQNTSGMSQEKFEAARDQLLQMAQTEPTLQQVRLSELPDVSTLKVDFNQERISALGLSTADVNNTIAAAWGGRYVNDFIDRGRVKRVYVQGDAPFRAKPEDIDQWSVRNSNGEMVPFSSFARSSWSTAPVSLSRFLGIQSYEFQGQPAPGKSSGDAMSAIETLASQIPGVGIAWSGQSYEERLSSGQAAPLYLISLLVVFLCLAALYESWSIPFAVILIIPLGLVGAIFAVSLRGLQNDVYLQIGLLTTMGLAAKNAILMTEFAERAEKQGKRVIEAALEAARIRLRPILMTSFAFIFGVLPLAISTGAGANSRIAIGTSVIGGMLTATILAIFYIPLFFVLVRRGVRDGLKYVREHRHSDGEATA
jgi:multidrug efflux pump